MKASTYKLFPYITILVLISCASTTNQKPTLDVNKIARVIGIKSSFVKSLVLPIGTKVDIDIHAVDGKKVGNFWSFPTVVDLSPGIHKLKIYCFGSHGSHVFNSNQILEVDVNEGKEYQIEPKFQTVDICTVSLIEKGFIQKRR